MRDRVQKIELPDNRTLFPCSTSRTRNLCSECRQYEALRLIDREGFSQEECGQYMNIARATVQQIYANARKKLADALVDGRLLTISGGHYRLCDGNESHCGCGGCHRHRRGRRREQ